jgi:hypothetical protein
MVSVVPRRERKVRRESSGPRRHRPRPRVVPRWADKRASAKSADNQAGRAVGDQLASAADPSTRCPARSTSPYPIARCFTRCSHHPPPSFRETGAVTNLPGGALVFLSRAARRSPTACWTPARVGHRVSVLFTQAVARAATRKRNRSKAARHHRLNGPACRPNTRADLENRRDPVSSTAGVLDVSFATRKNEPYPGGS